MKHAAAAAAAVALALSALSPVLASAQDRLPSRPLSLQQAVEEAFAGNAELAIAQLRRDIALGRRRRAASPLWPLLQLKAGYTRSNDPVAAFGTKLRQGRFGPEDLDFAVLNNPDPIGDWSTALGVRWSLLDPTVWAGRASAGHEAEAAAWAAARRREATLLVTRTLYHRAQAAASQLEAAQATERAAAATLDLFRKRAERGLLTEADLLQAEAELAAAEADRAEAERARLDALQQLGRHLGWSPDTVPEPSDPLAPPGPLPEAQFHPEARADLRALAAASDAAGAARARATLAYLPAVDVFANYATHAADAFSFDADNWTVGVLLRWALFDGFGRSADRQQAELRGKIARIEYDRALRAARSELAQTQRAVRSARRRADATARAAEAAEAGRRLMRRRFEEGLATAADLLQAEARATAMRQRSVAALAAYHVAVAQLDFVRSTSNPENQR